MTRIAGFELVASPCCQMLYAKARYSSVNFSSSAFWTDGKRENSLMPNDGGLRKCQCGTFFVLSECIQMGLEAIEPFNFPSHVSQSDLPLAIQTAHSQEVELAARRAYWLFLNEPYREKYKAHREAEQAAHEANWKDQWQADHPDTRGALKKFLDALLFRKPPSAPPAPVEPITFPPFEPTDVQITNMLRLIELVQISWPKYRQEYPVELVELYRELGMFDKAKQLIDGMSEANQDKLTKLLYELCEQKQAAPVRYKY
jgi:hypothetical protein